MPPSPSSLDRYRAIIPEWQAFLEAVNRPEPITLRVRRGRIDPEALRRRLEGQGFRLSPIPELPDFFRVDHAPWPLSETLEHWLGLFYMQQGVTGVAAPLLAPSPGERVLDLCAAPGGKTSHLADLMDDTGCLVAVEPAESRLHALLGNLARMAHPGTLALRGDALHIPETALFDRILADVPCSGEGRVRRGALEDGPPEEAVTRRLAELQLHLLRKAIRLLRPGGQVLYVTCTFAPEENEGVVSRILEDGEVRLIPLRPDLPHAPGLTGFEGEHFHPDLEGACRLYPHHLDSGGLFLALLERDGEGSGDPGGWTLPTPALPGEGPGVAAAERTIEEGRRVLRDEVGISDETMAGWSWVVRGGDVRVHLMGEWPLEGWAAGPALPLASLGLRALTPDRKGRLRPTTDLLRWVGPALGKGLVELDQPEWLRLLSGAEIRLSHPPEGFVALGFQGLPLARGNVRKGRVFHELSPGRSRWLRAVMERGG